MSLGWIMLHREVVGSSIWPSAEVFKLAVWCLLRANHKAAWVPITVGKNTDQVKIEPGQFIFGRDSAARELNCAPSTLWGRMQKLEKLDFLDIKSDSHYSIVTIRNWSTYQTVQSDTRQLTDSRPTADRHKQEQQEEKNNKTTPSTLRVSDADAGKIYDLYPRKIKRKQAITSIRSALKEISKRDCIDDPIEWLTSIVQQYTRAVSAWPEERKQFIPYPASWFNGGRYDDDQAAWVDQPPPSTKNIANTLPPEPDAEANEYLQRMNKG